MPLPPLNLDTRTYADLVDEARALIPRYVPQWSDHNASDPGITLLELFAWLVEQDIYRVNRVPERHRRAFVALTGTVCAPPRPATTILQITPHAGGDGLDLPRGLMFDAGAIPYRLNASVTLTRATLTKVQVFDGSTFSDVSATWRDGTGFAAFGDDPVAGAALYLGFDKSLPTARNTSLHFAVAGGHCGPGERALTPARADLRWSLWDGSDWQLQGGPAGVVHDGSRGLTLDGTVVLRPGFAGVASVIGAVNDPLYWLRCEPPVGRPERAPVLLDVAVNAVEATQRDAVVTRAAQGTGGAGQHVLLERKPVADGVIAAWTVEPDGPHQWHTIATLDDAGPDGRVFALDAQTGVLAFGDGRRGRPLPEATDLQVGYDTTLAAGGAITSGTTLTLAEGEPNATLLGGDPAVTATLIDAVASRPGGVAGTDAESLDHAAGRAAAALWSHERLLQLADDARADTLDQLARADVLALPAPSRAASLLDFERIALDVPGVEIARARAFGGLDGRLPSLHAPGTVTVVVVAGLPRAGPTPSASMLDDVAAVLTRCKTLGTRLVVVGPSYVEVTASATLRALRGVDPARVRVDASVRLREFLDPLRGGPSGRGWPFGRDVQRTEILAVLDAVTGVDGVTALTLAGPDGVTCARVCVGATSVVVSGAHAVEVTA
jgi:hypothetical protein